MSGSKVYTDKSGFYLIIKYNIIVYLFYAIYCYCDGIIYIICIEYIQ